MSLSTRCLKRCLQTDGKIDCVIFQQSKGKPLQNANRRERVIYRFSEIALVLVRFDQVASFIVNADHGIV